MTALGERGPQSDFVTLLVCAYFIFSQILTAGHLIFQSLVSYFLLNGRAISSFMISLVPP